MQVYANTAELPLEDNSGIYNLFGKRLEIGMIILSQTLSPPNRFLTSASCSQYAINIVWFLVV